MPAAKSATKTKTTKAPKVTAPLMKRFQGPTEKDATDAAKRWAENLRIHSALQVESIEAVRKGTDKYFATITYRE